MRDITSFINEERINEDELNYIILKNLVEISDVDIVDEVKTLMGDDTNSSDILRTFNFLKSKFGKNTRKWIITPCADYEKYVDRCRKWAAEVESKYKLGKDKLDILTGIGYTMNGI